MPERSRRVAGQLLAVTILLTSWCWSTSEAAAETAEAVVGSSSEGTLHRYRRQFLGQGASGRGLFFGLWGDAVLETPDHRQTGLDPLLMASLLQRAVADSRRHYSNGGQRSSAKSNGRNNQTAKSEISQRNQTGSFNATANNHPAGANFTTAGGPSGNHSGGSGQSGSSSQGGPGPSSGPVYVGGGLFPSPGAVPSPGTRPSWGASAPGRRFYAYGDVLPRWFQAPAQVVVPWRGKRALSLSTSSSSGGDGGGVVTFGDISIPAEIFNRWMQPRYPQVDDWREKYRENAAAAENSNSSSPSPGVVAAAAGGRRLVRVLGRPRFPLPAGAALPVDYRYY